MEINHFFVAGINYRKTDTATRGRFSIDNLQYTELLETAAQSGVNEVFVLSTCNRTEIYGIADHADTLIELLCRQTSGDTQVFRSLSYIKQGNEAVNHIFSVAAGLDSQILGDYEIVGQLKTAVGHSREKGFTGAFTERLFSTVLQSSKTIKNQTCLSGGTISVSFAAIRFLREKVKDIQNKKILLVGTGKIGQHTCRNIVDYLGTTNITLINRSADKAGVLAKELGLRVATADNLQHEIEQADIIIVAANASQPLITKENILNCGPKVLIDLSVPNNIEPAAGTLDHITLVNVDDLSKLNDETLLKRKAEVPKANAIIQDHTDEFFDWLAMRKHVRVLRAVKQKLSDIDPGSTVAIQKVVNTVAVKMQQQHKPGCHYIEAINDFMQNGAS